MNRKIWLASIIGICLVLAGCNGNKRNEGVAKEANKQETGEVADEVTEQQQYLEMIETDTFEQIVVAAETSNTENLGQEAFEVESDDAKIPEWQEEVTYIAEEYGEIQPYGGEFYYDEDTRGFYYNMEMFFLGSDFLYTMNDTLDEFYDGYLEQYQGIENWYMEHGESEFPEGRVPYSELLFLGIKHIDNDYVSLLFNDMTYMGGAHPYSMFDAITIDRCKGKEVSASEILGESDEEILEKVSGLMGLEMQADWTEIDFYLQEDNIVFFYRVPGYWEDVVLGR